MEQKFQSSFIPKKQMDARGVVNRAKKPATIFFWISVLVFGLTVLVTVTLFGYERLVLAKQLEDKKQDIQRQIESFDKELTETLTTMKLRIDTGEKLLSKHIATSAAFSLLQDLTVKSIFLNDFTLFSEPGKTPSLEAYGEAPNYAVLAFQSDTLKQSLLLSNVIVSDLNLNEFGKVVFHMTADIAPPVVSYREHVLASLTLQEPLEATTTPPIEQSTSTPSQ